MSLIIESLLCTACGSCVTACPFGALRLEGGVARVEMHTCTLCGACLPHCPKEAMSVSTTCSSPEKSAGEGILVFGELRDGVLAPVTLELIGVARAIAAPEGWQVEAALIGSAPAEVASELIAAGASRVYTVTHPELHHFRTVPYTKAAVAVIERLRPAVVLFGATTRGRDLAPRVAQRIGTGLTADCTELAFDEAAGVLLQTRPTFGGNVMATIVTPHHLPQMATVRPGVMPMPALDASREGEVVPVEVPLGPEDLITRVLSYVTEGRPAVPIDKAKILVAGGRGVGSREGFALLEELAEVLGAEVAGSRVAVEKGWIGQERQVGQTGTAVAPELYIACGISGSVQHRAGIKGAKIVAAINSDPDAPIFNHANFGVVVDLRQYIPRLTEAFRRALDPTRDDTP